MPAEDGTFVVRRLLQDGAIVLRPRGELDMATAPALERALSEAERQPASKVVVDLEELSFIDCSGIHALVDAHRRYEGDGRSMSLVNPGGSVRRVFELTSTTYLLDQVKLSGVGSDGAARRG